DAPLLPAGPVRGRPGRPAEDRPRGRGHPGPEVHPRHPHRGAGGGAAGGDRGGPRHRLLQRHRRAEPGGGGAGHRSGRRGDRAGVLLPAGRQLGRERRRHAGLRRRGPVDDGAGPGRHRAADHPAHQGDHAGPRLLDHGRHAGVPADRPGARHPGDRGRRGRAGRGAGGHPRRPLGRARGVLLLPGQGVRHGRRGRRRAHRRRRARPPGADAAQPRPGRRPPLPAPPDRPEQPLRRDPGRVPAAPAADLRRAAGAPGPDRRPLHRAVRGPGRPGRARPAGRPGRPLLLRLLAAGGPAVGPAGLAHRAEHRQPHLLPGAAAPAAGVRRVGAGRCRLAARPAGQRPQPGHPDLAAPDRRRRRVHRGLRVRVLRV
ncbi:MAG: Pleiotropic regulatory protein, partial [uncultured Corynebacteriales bacterium]